MRVVSTGPAYPSRPSLALNLDGLGPDFDESGLDYDGSGPESAGLGPVVPPVCKSGF